MKSLIFHRKPCCCNWSLHGDCKACGGGWYSCESRQPHRISSWPDWACDDKWKGMPGTKWRQSIRETTIGQDWQMSRLLTPQEAYLIRGESGSGCRYGAWCSWAESNCCSREPAFSTDPVDLSRMISLALGYIVEWHRSSAY